MQQQNYFFMVEKRDGEILFAEKYNFLLKKETFFRKNNVVEAFF